MALAHQQLQRSGRAPRFCPEPNSPRGRDALAEVIVLRPATAQRRVGLVGSLLTMARVFASPRAQAASVGIPPRPPSSPAPRLTPPAPDDAA